MVAQKFTNDPYAPAIKRATKIKMALTAESGAGKTYTGLLLASHIVAETGGKIAVLNTEGSDLSLYADKFAFNEVTLRDNYDPAEYVNYIHAAAEYGYTVLIIDSLSHAWNGTGGVLDIADKAKIKNNKLSGWIVARPAHHALVDAIVNTPVHLICTMRGKYPIDMDNPNAPKIMVPVQDNEMEFEFSLSGHLDHTHTLTIGGKSRYQQLPTGYASKNYKDIATRLVQATSGVEIPAWVTREKIAYLLNSLAQNGVEESTALEKIKASHRFDYLAWGAYESGQAAWAEIMGSPVVVSSEPKESVETVANSLEDAYEVKRVDFIRHAGKRRNDVLYRVVLSDAQSIGVEAVFAYSEHIEAFVAAGYADINDIGKDDCKPLVLLREDVAGYRIVAVQESGSSAWVDVKPKHAPETVRVEIVKLTQSTIENNTFYIASVAGGKTFDIYPPAPRSKRADQIKLLRDAGYGEWLNTTQSEWSEHPIQAMVDPRGDNWKLLSVQPREDDEFPDGQKRVPAEKAEAVKPEAAPEAPSATVVWDTETLKGVGSWLTSDSTYSEKLPCVGYLEAALRKEVNIQNFTTKKDLVDAYHKYMSANTDPFPGVLAGINYFFDQSETCEPLPFDNEFHRNKWIKKHIGEIDIEPAWTLHTLITALLMHFDACKSAKPENIKDDGKQPELDGMPAPAELKNNPYLNEDF